MSHDCIRLLSMSPIWKARRPWRVRSVAASQLGPSGEVPFSRTDFGHVIVGLPFHLTLFCEGRLFCNVLKKDLDLDWIQENRKPELTQSQGHKVGTCKRLKTTSLPTRDVFICVVLNRKTTFISNNGTYRVS